MCVIFLFYQNIGINVMCQIKNDISSFLSCKYFFIVREKVNRENNCESIQRKKKKEWKSEDI